MKSAAKDAIEMEFAEDEMNDAADTLSTLTLEPVVDSRGMIRGRIAEFCPTSATPRSLNFPQRRGLGD